MTEASGSKEVVKFDVVGTLIAPSERICEDPEGLLIEDPELLSQFVHFKFELAKLADPSFLIHQIGVTPGAYVATILARPDLMDPADRVVAVLDKLEEDRLRLHENADELTPLAAAECGVSAQAFSVLKAASALQAQGHQVAIELADQRRRQIPAPDTSAIDAAVPEKTTKPRKVDGEVAGFGRGDERGSWICLAKGPRIIVPGLALDRAWSLLQERSLVSGIAEHVEGELVFWQWDFTPAPDQQSLL